MAGELPFRDIVEYAIGGGWGEEIPTAGYVPVRIIRGTDFARLKTGTLDEVPARYEEAGKADRRRLADSDLVLEISGGSRTSKQSTGRSFLVRQRILDALGPHVIPASFCRLLRVKRAVADPQYAYYALQDMYVSGRAANYEQQSTGISNFQFEYFLDEEMVRLPPLPEQKRIAHVLGTLDDKIELNRRMNATLEGISRALFKSWFVDFDPVRQKAAGQQPDGMDAQTAAIFPDSFEDSEIGEVPKGWRYGTLGDVVDVFDSTRIPLSGREREGRKGPYPYYGAASVMDYVDAYLFDGVYLLMGEDGSVVRDDGTPVLQYVWEKFWVNNHAHVLRGRDGFSTEHLLLHLQSSNITAFVTGAVQPKLNQGNMNRIPVLLPSAVVCEAFSEEIQPLYAHFRANAEQSRTLAALRDTLLPKLLSGEIRVSEAEEAVGEAGG